MSGTGAYYFSNNVGLDSAQVKQDLLSHDPTRQIIAIKRVIANMTIGKDMTSHFSDVAKLVNSSNLEIKKLAYLYLMQNSKSQPEKAVLQAGVFVKDTQHASPLIRGIALRTMTSMLVPAMVEFVQGPLLKCLRDTDPYVRRTAALGVLKLYHLAPTTVEETGALELVLELLSDAVGAVVAAAVCVLLEIHQTRPHATIRQAIAAKVRILLAAMPDCAEWAQLYLLDGIAVPFTGPPSVEQLAEGEEIVNRVLPMLQSANPAVVLAATRVVSMFVTSYCGPQSPLVPTAQASLERRISAAIAPPLVSLVTTLRPELRFVALRNVKVLMQRSREALMPYLSSFFVKYDDPIYLKIEKIDVMLALATRANAALVLSELVEYAGEIDIMLVRKAVRSVGVLAVKVEAAVEQCVERLVQLIDGRVSYVVQEAAVVVQTVLRQYPNRFEGIIARLCAALDVVDDAESKAAVAWVLGEYADRLDNTAELLSNFFDSFADEPLNVRLAVLTATVKNFLKVGPGDAMENKQALEKVLALATTSPTVDLRDRAFFYWRLIKASPGGAQTVVLAPKAEMVDSTTLERNLRNLLVSEAGRVSSVFHRPISMILGDGRLTTVVYDDADDEVDQGARGAAEAATNAAIAAAEAREVAIAARDAGPGAAASPLGSDSPLSPPTLVTGRPGTMASPSTTPTLHVGGNASGVGGSTGGGGQHSLMLDEKDSSSDGPMPQQQLQVVLPASQGKGLEVSMAWVATAQLPQVTIVFKLAPQTSLGASLVKVMTVQLNTNLFGLGIAQEFPPQELRVGGQSVVTLAVNANNARRPVADVQVAVKVEPLGVLFFVAPPVPIHVVLNPATGYDPATFVAEFQGLAVAWSMPTGTGPLTSTRRLSPAALKVRMLHVIHRKEAPPLVGLYIFASCVGGGKFYAEVTAEGDRVVLATVRSTEESLVALFGEYLLSALKA